MGGFLVLVYAASSLLLLNIRCDALFNSRFSNQYRLLCFKF
jgi:hypothetical protein